MSEANGGLRHHQIFFLHLNVSKTVTSKGTMLNWRNTFLLTVLSNPCAANFLRFRISENHINQ